MLKKSRCLPSDGHENSVARRKQRSVLVLHLIFRRLAVAYVLYCNLKRGITPKIRMLCFVLANSVLFKPFLCLDLTIILHPCQSYTHMLRLLRILTTRTQYYETVATSTDMPCRQMTVRTTKVLNATGSNRDMSTTLYGH